MRTWTPTILYLALFMACGTVEDPDPINQEEVITTVRVTLTPSSGPQVILQSQDLDGVGPNPPVVSVSGNLVAGSSYAGTTEFLDESQNPAEDISSEVEEEGDEHQIFYQLGGNAQFSITYQDQDSEGNPIGLTFDLQTGTASEGTLLVTLRHQPDKSAPGVSQGDITNAGGETDVAQSFEIIIQ
ncbi:MAG: hypothetical protein OER04_05765 [Cyclobacteriaceae bacterium]|nr:hypothetical protein [Cyclobacteriaceae bacterium]